MVLLQKYSTICGAAGDEEHIRAAIEEELRGSVDEMKINPLGNLTAVVRGEDLEQTVLLTAHMDEVALIVKSIEKNGLLKFYSIGGVVPKILIGNTVAVGKNKTPGVIAYKSYHIMTPEEKKKIPDVKELAIDVGASSSDELKEISPGDYAYFRSDFFCQGDCFFGKAFDDRAGCAAVTEVLKSARADGAPPVTVTAVFTAQEEVGLRGGATAAYGLRNVLFNLNLEGTACSDRELKKTYTPVTVSGAGPAITFMDRTSITQRHLLEFVQSIAKNRGIPFQLKRAVAGGTDAGATHLTEEGIPAVTMSVPVRYIHSPWGIMNRKDFENFVELARALVKEAHHFRKA